MFSDKFHSDLFYPGNKRVRYILFLAILCLQMTPQANTQTRGLVSDARQAMLNATRYMVEEVSTNGGYLWHYLPDFSRSWGEMEAYNTMIWVQPPGTVSMAHTFLDAYRLTGEEYYYQAAERATEALIWGQSVYGGWNYMIDFAGDRSLKEWYSTIGKNGWRLEEFHYYYGNDTFDDDVTSDAARVILRMYLERLDPKFKPALDKAIEFILESQYPLGGWPQRYPLRYDHVKGVLPDYTSYYTFNDDVVWENINFLTQCYLTLGQQRLLEPIRRGMEFYLITLQGNPQAGWAMQYTMDIKPAAARTYEPEALAPSYTLGNAMHLIRFYEWTGDRKFIDRVPDIIGWLERTELPADASSPGRGMHPTFVEIGTDKPVYVHRRGSNVKFGEYYYDYNEMNLLGHYGGKRHLNIERLRSEYKRVVSLSPGEAMKNSPLKPGRFDDDGTGLSPQHFYNLNRTAFDRVPDENSVIEIINALDDQHRWLVRHMQTSNPYAGPGQKSELTDEFATTHVGDETDTSPFRDESDQKYISMREYINNMNLLMNYIRNNSHR